MRSSRPLFELGQIVKTKSIAENVEPSKIASLIRNHITGDFGILENADIDANKDAIQNGDRVLSAYMVQGKEVYVITEWDRSHTTVVYADEHSIKSGEKVVKSRVFK
ncbi:hypothetical protein [Metabacillus malikii]|uniref:Uncharacterized protein n=1 Tax=Metabacillus malikii TaxID=1504265 RepID=A0ABT9ZCX4_9BACI|nr:hypothetical protein [Metabacillus malikii]MDQ0229702.1 hypothetical protein [Metabacillus malikii]